MRRVLAMLVVVGAWLPAVAAGSPPEPSGAAEMDPHEARIKRYPFRESSMVWFQSLGAMGLVKSSELTWKPYYDWLWRVYPRYYFTDKLSLRVKVGLEIEWTNSPDTTTQREPNWEDIWVDIVYSPVWTVPRARIEITPSLRLVIPTSKLARAETQYIGIGPGFALRRSFDLPRRMSLELSYAFRYTKFINHYTTLQYQGQPLAGCAAGPDSGNCGAGLQSGASSVSHQFINMLAADLNITKKLTVELFVAFFNYLTYGVPSATVQLPGGEMVTLGPDPGMNVNHRASVWYLLSAEYQIHPIVRLGLAVSTWTPQLAPDSTYYAPFVNRYTQFVLSTTIALDHVVARIERAARARRGRPAVLARHE
jgi:hypothetical protein